ncbi:undecaprenyl/decaprenyl-phosphate alpha-N-acetylglucosaminyl 1-phosphate transferase [Rossellomorea vietnamensis]|uniref:Undecaprenyl/decaprenyl-phosphate alpha-N-acetylglucosaminyl 1-phosphate transferase n=1 Tax=Rossellomorea vietnamensis TaxID=218284 RepID=A0A5D4KGN5_9BACI|nr:MraY family glycosyltransferase [Rossellomorea vietnamensis]TYR76020.1 undecaprenyl/decaprenyl-phosphate alpha-N-acetylglucosaminyl 1-phosphate transferase [Rossellomorea vietnamensis]
MIYITLAVTFIASILLTPLIKRLAVKVGATDKPNYRKVHERVMPRLGGLAIYLSFLLGIFLVNPSSEYKWSLILGASIIIVTGIIDDTRELSPKVKLAGQLLAAVVVVVLGDIQVQTVNLPFGGQIEPGIFSIPLTILWVIGVTNAINLIDGLDGLAAGVSAIALFTISIMAMLMGNTFVIVTASILLVSTIGFLFYNFHPASIFMGDTGSLFLGFMISVLSLLGFKNITFISLVIPVIILGVPLSDTFFAIIRRYVNKQPLSAPDKSHLHHCLLRMGYSHRQTVLIIYAIAAMFSLAALMFSLATLWGALLIALILLIAIELFVESIGLVGTTYKPLLRFFKEKNSS